MIILYHRLCSNLLQGPFNSLNIKYKNYLLWMDVFLTGQMIICGTDLIISGQQVTENQTVLPFWYMWKKVSPFFNFWKIKDWLIHIGILSVELISFELLYHKTNNVRSLSGFVLAFIIAIGRQSVFLSVTLFVSFL